MSESRREFLKLSGLAAAAACSGCASGMGNSSGWSRKDLDFLETASSRNSARGWAAWQGGRKVASQEPAATGPSLSITKSIAALGATRAAGEGWLDPGERVSETITEWKADSRKSGITVLMLLQQTSGLEAGVIPLYRNHPAEKGRAATTLTCVDTPGTVFRYGPGHWEVLAEVMRRKLARKNITLASFMHGSVMRPVGLNSSNWRSDKQGVPYFSTGTELSVTELGRLGRTIGSLLNHRGTDGFSADHFSAITRPSPINPMFGGGLWRNSLATRAAVAIEVERSIDGPLPASYWNRSCLSTGQPVEMVALIGSGGKRVYIWPKEEKRFVRLGLSSSWSDVAFLAGLQNT